MLRTKQPISHEQTEFNTLGQLGSLETRLARTKYEVKQSQALRYQVFCKECGAKPNARNRLFARDIERLDNYCDHLLVIDNNEKNPRIIGTSRLMDNKKAEIAGSFYSQGEFNIKPLLGKSQKIMEVSRSCIASTHRSKRAVELLWAGVWIICIQRKIDTLFGCVSLPGTDPDEHTDALQWLSQNALIDEHDNCPAIHRSQFDLPTNKKTEQQKDDKRIFAALPPLLKGYLRLGAKVSHSAVIDHTFKTIDLLIILKVSEINPKYLQHYGVDASRFAA